MAFFWRRKREIEVAKKEATIEKLRRDNAIKARRLLHDSESKQLNKLISENADDLAYLLLLSIGGDKGVNK